FTGTVLGPDGQPLAGTWGIGLDSWGRLWDDLEPMKTARFTIHRFNPNQPREVLLQHPGKGLVGAVEPPKVRGESVTARVQPGATVTGRLVDSAGEPRADVEFRVLMRPKVGVSRYLFYFPPQYFRTDQDGRFRVGSLLPGYEFLFQGEKGESGKGLVVAGD